ncbi:MAG: hypothetical protein U0931_28525 [Vulcanimicrobiota bacterium]
MSLPIRSELAQKVHQLNNLLGIIQGYADLLLVDLPPQDGRAELVREILKASDQATLVSEAIRRGERPPALPEAC